MLVLVIFGHQMGWLHLRATLLLERFALFVQVFPLQNLESLKLLQNAGQLGQLFLNLNFTDRQRRI